MRTLVLGGYGFIGLAVARRLHAAGHRVVGLGRRARTGRRLLPQIEWIGADISQLTEPDGWWPHLHGVDVVVNTAGALQDGARDDLGRVQERAIIALVAACEAGGVRRFVQVSAPGARIDASTRFMRTKARADQRVADSSMHTAILRPGLVVGAGAYGGTALIRMLAAWPLVQPLVLGDRIVSTVALREVAEIVFLATEGRLPSGADLDLVEPRARTLREVVDAFRIWLALPEPMWRLDVPGWVGMRAAKIGDVLGYAGWRSPLRSTALRVLSEGVTGNPSVLRALRGADLASLEETLAALPATVQERWFARLYLLLPVVIATLSAFWLLSGIFALLDLDRAAAMLPADRFSRASAHGWVICGAAVDLVLGGAVLFRRWTRWACLAMAAVTLAYLVGASLWRPDLWVDPLGVLIKAVPAAVLALVAAVLVGDR